MSKRYSLCIFKTPVMHDQGEWVRYGDYLAQVNSHRNDILHGERVIKKLKNEIENVEYQKSELRSQIDSNIDAYCLLIDEKNKWKNRFFTLLGISSVAIGYLLWTGLN